MEKQHPLFSIVIPTRNRADLLPNALRSAINQQFDDYEIVIMANDCQDNTREVVHSMANSRVRYFETEKMLNAVDNWEYLWTKAKGQYIVYLSDDDALIPSALSIIATQGLNESPPLICWEDAFYYYPGCTGATERQQNVLLIFNFNDNLIVDYPTSTLRKSITQFENIWHYPQIPKVSNCAINRIFFEEIKTKIGHLFYPIAPDQSFMWIALHLCSYVRVIHKPLSTKGIHNSGAGSYKEGYVLSSDYLKEYGNQDFLSNLPMQIPLITSHIASTFLKVKNRLLNYNIITENLQWEGFFIAIANQLKECQHLIPEYPQYEALIYEKSKKISSSLHQRVKAILEKANATIASESLMELHLRTQKMALEYLPNLNIALKKHDNDLQCALCSLALKDELLVDADWNYLYLFGKALSVSTIYDMSLYAERYHTLLINCHKKRNSSHEM